MDDVLSRKAGKLSGGWQRRVSIAMALISEPKILFLDEPTLGLDVIARHELWETIRSLKGKITIILTTHYMEEAEALSDRIGIMKNGKLLAVGTVDELNKKVGGVATSQHTKGQAADCGVDDPLALARLLIDLGLEFDQAIVYPTFLHISYKADGENRNQLLYNKSYKGDKVA